MPYGDTPKLRERSLCFSCRKAVIIKGEAASDYIVKCSEIDAVIKFHVVECNSHLRKAELSLGEMAKVAWAITSDGRGTIGFVRPADIRNNKELQEEFISIRYKESLD